MGKGRDKRKKKQKQAVKGEQKMQQRGPGPVITLVDEQADISKERLAQGQQEEWL